MGKDGVSYYTTATATVKIHFPEEEIKCKHCRFCIGERTLDRYKCLVINDFVYYPSSCIEEDLDNG